MKLRRKLLAAGFAFGATALTLTTSTFAWYTGNNTVDVSSVSGMTETTLDTSSFYATNATTYGTVTKFTEKTDLENGDSLSGLYTLTLQDANAKFVAGKAYYNLYNGVYQSISGNAGESCTGLYLAEEATGTYSSGTYYNKTDNIIDPVNSRVTGVNSNYTSTVSSVSYVGNNTVLKPVALNSNNYYTMTNSAAYTENYTAATPNGLNLYVADTTESSGYKAVAADTAWAATTYYKKTTIGGDDIYSVVTAYSLGLYTASGSGENITYTAVAANTAWVAAAKYYTKALERTTDTIEYTSIAGETTTSVVSYALRFKTATAAAAELPIYVSGLEVTNSATKEESTQAALAAGGTTGITASSSSYNVDLLHALKMSVYVTNLNSDGGYDNNSSIASYATYDLDSFADTSKDSNIGTANAVGYFNTVTGSNIATPASYDTDYKKIKVAATAGSTNSTTSQIFSIPTTGYVEVRFVFWLDGWDSYCYDVCRRQQFAVSMSFSTSDKDSILTTTNA